MLKYIILISLLFSSCASYQLSGQKVILTATRSYPHTQKTLLTSTTSVTTPPIQTSTEVHPTHTPVNTPTPILPVSFAEGLPILSQSITSDNVSSIREIGYWCSPVVHDFEITKDGNLGFVATTDGVFVYDLGSNDILDHIHIIIREDYMGDGSYADAIGLTRDGNRFVVLTKTEAIVWELNKGIIFKTPINAPLRSSLPKTEISPNGKLLAVRDCVKASPQELYCQPQKIDVYDLDLGQKISNHPDLIGGNQSFRFSSNGSLFIIEEKWVSQQASVWDTVDWHKLTDVSLSKKQAVGGASFDGKLIALQDDDKVLIYQTNPWKLIRQITISLTDAHYHSSILFSSNQQFISILEDSVISVWNITTGELINSCPRLLEYNNKCILEDDGNLVCFEIPDKVYQLMNIKPGLSQSASLQYRDENNSLTILISNTSTITLETESYSSCLIPPNTSMICQDHPDLTFLNQDSLFYNIRPTEEEDVYQIFLTGDEPDSNLGSFRSSDMRNKPLWISSDLRYFLVEKFSWTPSGPTNDVTELWDIRSQSLIKSWQGLTAQFAYSPNGFSFAIVLEEQIGFRLYPGSFMVYDALENEHLLSQPQEQIGPMAFTNDGKLIYLFPEKDDSQVKIRLDIFDPEKKEIKNTEISFGDDHFSSLHDIAISPDATLLAVGLSLGEIKIFDLINEHEIHTWLAHCGEINDLEFSADGKILWSSSMTGYRGDGYIKAWGLWP